MKILYIIDKIEFKYFELNKLVTNFWLVAEFLLRGYEVYITTNPNLYLRENLPFAKCFKAFYKDDDIFKMEESSNLCINNFDFVFFRPDPPVDTDYINATYILSYVNSENTLCINSPQAIRDKNEKLYINEFEGVAPKNIVSADKKIIKEFLFKNDEIIIKPLNRCFSSGVFYLHKSDKNINAIIDNATNNGQTVVMVQKYMKEISKGDKRLIYICGEILPYCVVKKASNDDFKFNEHNDENLLKGELTEAQKNFQNIISEKMEKEGVYLAGLDVIEDKIIEINITSPCFFIKEINNLYGIELEKIIVNKLEALFKSFLEKKETFCK